MFINIANSSNLLNLIHYLAIHRVPFSSFQLICFYFSFQILQSWLCVVIAPTLTRQKLQSQQVQQAYW